MTIATEQVKYRFSQAEMLEFGQELTRTIQERAAFEDELAQIKADYKGKDGFCENVIRSCSRRIQSGYEMRQVPCLVLKFRPSENEKLTIRTDTGRVLRRERLREEDRQMVLTTEAPEPYAFELSLLEMDGDSEIATVIPESVQVTEREYLRLQPVLGEHQVAPLRKGIEAT